MIPCNLGTVTVRYLECQDHESYIALEKDAVIKQYVGGPSPRTKQDLKENLGEYRPQISLMVIADSETNKFIGRCGLLEGMGLYEAELYILLANTHHKRGIASVVVPFLVQLASSKGKAAVAYVDPNNNASIKLMNRVGAIHAGIAEVEGYQDGHLRYVFPIV